MGRFMSSALNLCGRGPGFEFGLSLGIACLCSYSCQGSMSSLLFWGKISLDYIPVIYYIFKNYHILAKKQVISTGILAKIFVSNLTTFSRTFCYRL